MDIRNLKGGFLFQSQVLEATDAMQIQGIGKLQLNRVLPFKSGKVNRAQRLIARAEGSDQAVPGLKAGVPILSSRQTGPLPFLEDNESFQDLLAFTGPAPERINGRVAMWAFLICALTEVFSKQSVPDQVLAHPVSATVLSLLISIGSIAPKYVSGVSLKDLQDSASREGLPPGLRFFNKTHEIWLGRVAMLGLLGLAGVEVYLGHPLFVRG